MPCEEQAHNPMLWVKQMIPFYISKISDIIFQGDSGGPLNCKGRDGKWYVQGVTSFVYGRGCNTPQKPTMFTRVATFIPWISEVSLISTRRRTVLLYSRLFVKCTNLILCYFPSDNGPKLKTYPQLKNNKLYNDTFILYLPCFFVFFLSNIYILLQRNKHFNQFKQCLKMLQGMTNINKHI